MTSCFRPRTIISRVLTAPSLRLRVAFLFSAFLWACLVFILLIKKGWWLDYLFTNTFSVPEKQSFLSTYFGLTHGFPLPLGRWYFRRCCFIPLGGINSATPSLSPSREEILSCCRTTSSKTGARSSDNSQGYLTPSTQMWVHARKPTKLNVLEETIVSSLFETN